MQFILIHFPFEVTGYYIFYASIPAIAVAAGIMSKGCPYACPIPVNAISQERCEEMCLE